MTSLDHADTSRFSQHSIGALSVFGGSVSYCAMDAIVKLVSNVFPVFEISFFRLAFSLIPLALVSLISGTPLFKTSRPFSHLVRCLFGTVGMILIFRSFAFMTLLDVTVLISTCPIFMVVLSVPLLKEKVTAASWATVIFGFVCVLFVLQPTASTFSVSSLLPIAGSFFVAIYIVSARMLAGSESATSLAAYMAIVGSVVTGATLPFNWVTPDPSGLLLLVAIGIVGGVGLLLRTSGYRLVPPGIVAPIEYTSILWSGLIGYLAFAEIPKISTIVAGLLIVCSNLTLLYIERRRIAIRNAQLILNPQ
jgi:drug/metabolite transporter (DMT)-like permease